jgi:hypothetical protein
VDVVLKSVVIVVKNVLTSGIEGCNMNERIEKLFNEAGFHKPEMERLGIEHKFEKFAELIILECVDVCMKNQFSGAENYNNGAVSSAEFIKERFGIDK